MFIVGIEVFFFFFLKMLGIFSLLIGFTAIETPCTFSLITGSNSTCTKPLFTRVQGSLPFPPWDYLMIPLYFSPNSTRYKVIGALVHPYSLNKWTESGPPQPGEEPFVLLHGQIISGWRVSIVDCLGRVGAVTINGASLEEE